MPATASGIRAEFGLAVNGLLGFGDLGEVSRPSLGGDAALNVVHGARGFGARVAGGIHLLQGYSLPTGEVTYNGIGTQPGKFEARQSLWWLAIGPVWTGPLWRGRIAVYAMAGRAIATASSEQAWTNTQGADPGGTHVTIVRAGVGWSPADSPLEIGTELLTGGHASFWANPPVITDSFGHHVLQSRSAALNGAVLRLSYRFGL